MTNKQRKDSSIINIRTFHNWIKRELIVNTSKIIRNNNPNYNVSLLDLAVGKGGDIQKWYDSKIMYAIGFDIDKPSLFGKNGAVNRYNYFIKNKKLIKEPIYKFYQADLSSSECINKFKTLLNDKKFDIASCQFAIHYMFKDEKSLDNFIKLVSLYISDGGYFIGTTINGSKVRKLLTSSNNVIGNDIYKISGNMTDNIYGNKYTVSLGKSTDTEHYFANKDSIEYLVDINELKKVCEKYELVFVGMTKFKTWYELYMNNTSNKKNIMSDNEKEFSLLNFSFVFRKSIHL